MWLFKFYSLIVLTCYAISIIPPKQSLRKKIVMLSNSIGQIQGEVIVRSPSIIVRGPPKGFPLVRQRRATTKNITSLIESSVNVPSDFLKSDSIKGKKGKIKIKSGLLKKIWPYMLVPAMMSLGFAPLLLTKLKVMVMSAFMVNMMALNAAIFLTLRNMVFGPRSGEHIKYYNFGYSHKHHKHPHIVQGEEHHHPVDR